jgi:REP element-mobilizing transposase RayT
LIYGQTITNRISRLSYLESASNRYGAVIHAYCLMDNHYHILIETPLGNLSKIMQHINSAYTTYFNLKRERSGHLFQGRYRSILVEVDEYAKELSRYIHLNPVRAKMVKTPEEYQWSSYSYYADKKKKPEWLYRDFILGYFGKRLSTSQRNYKEFVHSLVEKDYDSPFADVIYSVILGSPEYAQQIKDTFLKNKPQDRELPALEELIDRPDIDTISDMVDSLIQTDDRLAKQIKLYFCHKYSGLKLKEIGKYFGIGESGVSQTGRRLSDKLKRNKNLSRKVAILKKKLKL